MKREKLKYKILDKGGYQGETKAYIKEEADSVMDAMEARIKELEEANRRTQNQWMESRMSLKATKIYARFASEEYDDFGEVDADQFYYRKEHADKVIDELEATISKLEKVAPKWISVNGKLPPEGMVVIAFSPQGVFPAYYESYSHKDFAWWIDGKPVCNVTHWMKLPEPPTAEDSSVTEKEK